MNQIHNNGENDQSLNDGLDTLGRAYRQLQQDEPPELLDQAILNSAHRAVEKKPHWMKFGWLHGLTTAAVFVLAFSIILNQREAVLVPENGIMNKEAARYQRQDAVKKEPGGYLSELRTELKAKSDDQRDMLQAMPTAAAPESAVMGAVPKDQAVQTVSGTPGSAIAREKLLGISPGEDKDFVVTELLQDEALLEEADVVADSAHAGAISKQTRPAAVVKPLENELKARTRTSSEAEQKLLDIISLKQSGNARWRTELESFKENYPDYPLPDELQN